MRLVTVKIPDQQEHLTISSSLELKQNPFRASSHQLTTKEANTTTLDYWLATGTPNTFHSSGIEVAPRPSY